MNRVDSLHQQQQLLDMLRGTVRDYVTYAQIEGAMEALGLDPYTEVDLYTAVLEALDEQGIRVIDQDLSTEPQVDEDQGAEEIADEVVAELSRYQRSVEEYAHPLLTAEQERRLLEIYHDAQRAKRELAGELSEKQRRAAERRINAGEQALEELLRHNLRLIANVAYRVARYSSHLTLDDLIQEGRIGLMRAIEKFNLSTNIRLSTYATWWIRQAIYRAHADLDRTIRIPVHAVEACQRLNRLRLKFIARCGQEPSEEELAQLSGLSVQKIRLYQRITQSLVSLEKPVGDGDTMLGDLLPSSGPGPEVEAEAQELRANIRKALLTLSEREREVLILRYGLAEEECRTLEEIGNRLGVTRERIRQIEVKALMRLRRPQAAESLQDWL
ncbi:sigma-70 family RNA polymerase sigma factor [Kallotenue papyrolyticum]|uniref:sigma-70 family RNA polymerase sigma factor n=1 Tax=Kallotenue papyrolyticum TaxID=1325125 RepID=UPI000472A6F9|nr:sigma-70 family RNA polymerase sigma factor [Kallotenue papyrolyticum]